MATVPTHVSPLRSSPRRTPRPGRRLGASLLVTALAVALAPALSTPAAAAAGSAAATGPLSAATLNSLFREYGDTSGQWNGGDSTASVSLPDGRVAWLFSDTFIGPINPDGSRPTTNTMVHNSLVVQQDGQLVSTLVGGTPDAPLSLAGGELDDDPDNAGYWVADGVVEGQTMRVLYNKYRRTGNGGLDVALEGTALGTFALPSLTLQTLTELPLGDTIAWGGSLTESGGYTYIYGTEFADTMRFAHVARVPSGGLTSSWQFWTGSGWSSAESDSARLLSGVTTAYSVHEVDGTYLLVTTEGNLTFNADVVAYTAPSPTGPFTGPTVLFTAPEPQPFEPIITYDARLHPELAQPGKLLISYNVNSLENELTFADAGLYRPRFVDVDWPLPVPDPASLPATPAGLTGTADDLGVVHLSWQPVTADRYWIHQRDVTAGQTHFARRPHATTEPTADVTQLRTGHTYEFRVTAANEQGESPPSTELSLSPHFSPPSAPTGLTVTPQPDGQLAVSWNAVPEAWSYHVYRRDLTAGDTDYVLGATVGGTEVTLNWLEQDHEYELYVTAEHGGGTSGPSATARATVHYPTPPVPTGLTATANADGTITLNWTAPGPDVWYWVYQRDVTAGEPEFTKLPLPISSGTTLTAQYLLHDHEYEFAVSSTSRGGESALSEPARATAHYPTPAAPTNLTAVAGDGGVTLSWTAPPGPEVWYWVYRRDVTAGEPEFTKLPLPISSGTSLTVEYLDNGHTYEFRITSTSQGGESTPSNTVRATPQVPLPGLVTGVSARANADGSITVTWDALGPDIWYRVHQRDATAGEAWQQLPLPVSSGTTFVARYLTHNHRYEYKIAATNAAGDGPTSSVAGATSHYQPPPAPRDLVGRAAGDGSIDLDWQAPEPDLYYWVYYRDATAGESFTRSAVPTQNTWASWKFLKHNHVYEFKVTADSQGGEGPASNTARVTAKGGLPAAPTNLTASAGDGKVTLRWTASSSSNVYYWIEYRQSGGSWTRLPDPYAGCCSFTMNLLDNGTTYDFRVRATNVSGDSGASNVASARPMPPLPAAPSGLTASAGDGKATLRWNASSTSYVSYWIEMRPSGGSWRRLPYPVSCCSFTANLLNNGTTYDFRVRATNLRGDSGASNVTSVRPMPPFPQAPSNLRASARGDHAATLTWSASPTRNVYYWIEYRLSGGSWKRLPYPVASCCSFLQEYLTPLRTYEFRVRATNLSGTSAPSNTDSVYLAVTPPGAPGGVTAMPVSNQQAITVRWTGVPGATGYSVHGRPCGSSGSWSVLGFMITSSIYTVRYLAGCWNLRVVADRYGVEGPVSRSARAYTTYNDYPYRNYVSWWTDGWGFKTRECTSFVTYRIRQHHISGFNGWWRQPGLDHWWHAKNWDSAAARAGVRYDRTPTVGSVAQWEGGTYGHVAFVVGTGNGTIMIEEYNGAVSHGYSTRIVSASSPSRYIHFEDW